jgi:hypothetical protein
MKIQLNTNLIPIFTGTYESPFWEVREYNEDGSEEMEVDYNFKELMATIAKAYHNKEDYILSELNVPFIKSIKFNGEFYSPRAYNFSTDTLDFEVDINKKELMAKLEELKNDQGFEKYLHDHFTSYDGFWSNTPNNYNDLVNEIKTWGKSTNTIDGYGREFDQAIGALITYLAGLNNKYNDYSIEEMVANRWQGNGYGGLDYKIVHEAEGNCPIYPNDKILPNENGDCSLCGAVRRDF